jgi:hypothetical protein
LNTQWTIPNLKCNSMPTADWIAVLRPKIVSLVTAEVNCLLATTKSELRNATV